MPLFLGIGGVAVVLIIIVVVVASGSSTYEDPEEAYSAFLSALRAGDGGTVYELLSDQARQSLEEPAKMLDMTPKQFCKEAISGVRDYVGRSRLAGAVESVMISDVKVDGDRAIIYTKTPEGPGEIVMVWERGGWRIDM